LSFAEVILPDVELPASRIERGKNAPITVSGTRQNFQSRHCSDRLAENLCQRLDRRQPDPQSRKRPRPRSHGKRSNVVLRKTVLRKQPRNLRNKLRRKCPALQRDGV